MNRLNPLASEGREQVSQYTAGVQGIQAALNKVNEVVTYNNNNIFIF